MTRLLLVYSTVDGHTAKIARYLQQYLEARAHRVTLHELNQEGLPDPATYDKIVVGSSIRYGKHHPSVYQFIQRHQSTLESLPSSFFSVNLVARKPEKNQPDTNPYVRKFLATIHWKPRHAAVFAGVLDYPSYRILDRWMIRLIMWITKGPTDPATCIEYTDWDQVRAFAESMMAE
jgi:menaquinone-dependent protoporphyrinogen oxidase